MNKTGIQFGTRNVKDSMHNGKVMRREEEIVESFDTKDSVDAMSVIESKVKSVVNAGARKNVNIKFDVGIAGDITRVQVSYTREMFNNHK